MNYIISEEELKELIESYPYPAMSKQQMLKNFLKSKQPVEMICKCEVHSDMDAPGETYLTEDFEIPEKYIGKSIEIYIRTVE